MFHTIKEYFKFLTKASNQHGVHSPFVYNLVTQCFYKKTAADLWNSFLISKQLLDTKTIRKVTSLHSTSKTARISTKKAKLLIRLIAYFKPENILEIGTSMGLGTAAIQIGNKNSSIISIESCPQRGKIKHELFKKNNFNTIHIVHGNWNEALPKVLKKQQFDFIYFNKHQTKKETLQCFNRCLNSINNDAIWVFNDIYSTIEIQEAWLEIKNHPKVTVTVDVFFLGIIFFRKEQAKEHFKIRV
ncbi:MAG: Uncharacterised protein [Polaribacter sejongensis]|nr:MAG: Uncharacterised protein [Polaribacter sejongensis]